MHARAIWAPDHAQLCDSRSVAERAGGRGEFAVETGARRAERVGRAGPGRGRGSGVGPERDGSTGWTGSTASTAVVRYHAQPMMERLRAMPGGIRLFLAYALLILAGIGLSLRFVVDQAISAPVSPIGVVVMVLLAYTIFTTTLILQRKQVARGLAIGLASLTIPLIPLLALSQLPVEAVFIAVLSLLLFRGLLGNEVRAYLSEP